MRIDNIWNLTREAFIVQVEGTREEADKLLIDLGNKFPEKIFLIHLIK